MKYCLFILSFLCGSLASPAQKGDSLLMNAYTHNSSDELKMFFDNWESEMPAISDSAFECLNDTIKNIYEVYRCFYAPTDPGRMGGFEWRTRIYPKVKYLLVQEEIEYGFTDVLEKDALIKRALEHMAKGDTAKLRAVTDRYKGRQERLEQDWLSFPHPRTGTLKDFRPQLAFDTIKTVILTPEYNRLLNTFLGDKDYKQGTKGIIVPAGSERESAKRQVFLENYIKIWYGQWGSYWHLYSYPRVTNIVFDRKFEYAVIDYRMVYEGGYAYFKQIDGVWKMLDVRRTWII